MTNPVLALLGKKFMQPRFFKDNALAYALKRDVDDASLEIKSASLREVGHGEAISSFCYSLQCSATFLVML